jgi:hypothetical protein
MLEGMELKCKMEKNEVNVKMEKLKNNPIFTV